MSTYYSVGVVHRGGMMLREVEYGVAESVLGDEYVLTDERTKRSFLCLGDERAAAMACAEAIRLSEQP